MTGHGHPRDAETPTAAIGLVLLGAGPCTTREILDSVDTRWSVWVLIGALRAMEAADLIRRVQWPAGNPGPPPGEVTWALWVLTVDARLPTAGSAP